MNVLVPALMTIATVQGFNTMKDTARKLRGSGVFAATMSVIGVVFGAYVAVKYTVQVSVCVREIGDIARCAEPRNYFAKGLFGEMICGFEKVERFNCGKSSVRTALESQVYATMTNLTHIDMSNTPVMSIPSSWGMLQNLTSLRLRGSQVRSVPWAVVTLPLLDRV